MQPSLLTCCQSREILGTDLEIKPFIRQLTRTWFVEIGADGQVDRLGGG